MGLGDTIERALSLVGITKERVSKWVGSPCGCIERQEKLNQLGWWAARILFGRTEKAREHLDVIMETVDIPSSQEIPKGPPV